MPKIDPTRHNFRSEGPDADERGGFYVSVISGSRYVLALGPFEVHAEAEGRVPDVKRYVNEHDPRGAFYAYGTSRVTEGDLDPGKLNEVLA